MLYVETGGEQEDRLSGTTLHAGAHGAWTGSGLLGRRRFLRGLCGIPAGIQLLPLTAVPASAQEAQQFLSAIGKDPRMIVHDAESAVLETPVELLRERPLTPKEFMFVRNNQVLPGALTLAPYPSDSWNLELSGLVTPARTVSLSELMRLEQTLTVAVLQCAGNGRAFYARSATTSGTQWRRGGMAQVAWAGVRLRDLLDALDLRVSASARFVTAEGHDPAATPADDDYEQSVSLEDVLDTALLATSMNGEPIPAIHGGPLRLVIPGYYGSMNVKWLSRLRFEEGRSSSRHHAQRYRTFRDRIEPGTAPEVTEETTNSTWRQKIKTVIWEPAEEERRFPGPFKVSGVAWNDGRTEIVAAELSTDGGNTWCRVNLEAPLSPYGWHPWHATLWYEGNGQLRPGGTVEDLRVRAFDAYGRSQPDDGSVHWNPSGYEWYGVDRVKVNLH